MLDITARDAAGTPPIDIRSVEFFRIELSLLADGMLFVAMTATTVDDEEEPQLIDQEVVCDRVTAIDEVLALIRKHVRIGATSHAHVRN